MALKIIFTKLNKDPERIDLSIVDDLDQRKEKFIQKNKEIKKMIDDVLKFKSKFKSEFKQLSNEFEKLTSDYDDLFKKASEIGADELGTKAFRSNNELASAYGSGWDNETLKYLQQ